MTSPVPGPSSHDAVRPSRARWRQAGAYGAAVVLSVATVALRLAADPWLGAHPTMTIFLAPVLLAALLGGVGPGLAATMLTAVLTGYFVAAPRQQLAIEQGGDLVAWAGFVVSGVVVSMLVGAARRPAQGREGPPPSAPMEWKVHVLAIVALAMLGATGALSYYSIEELRASMAEAEAAKRRVDAMEALAFGVRDLETAVGRYVISGSPSQLPPYAEAVANVGRALAALRGMAAAHPELAAPLDSIGALVDRRIAVAERVIELRRLAFEPARDVITSGEGMRLTVAIQAALAQMERDDSSVLQGMARQSIEAAQVTRAAIVVGFTLTLLFVAAAMLIIHRDFSGRRRALAALSEARDTLEVRVRERIDELARSRDALAASEAQLRLITDTLPALIAHVGPDRRYRFANALIAKRAGMRADEVVGKTVAEVLGASYPQVKPDIDAAFTGRTVSVERTFDWPGGGTRTFAGVLLPELDARRRVTGVFVLLTDVTEQRRTEAQRRRVERAEALGTLAGGIAHDFNNILPAIRGFTALVAQDLPPEHPAQEKLARIETAARRASDLVRRILAFGRPRTAATANDVREAALEALQLVRAAVPKLIAIETDIAAELPAVNVDPTDVYQVIVNLVTNAADAIGRSNTGTIRVSLQRAQVAAEAALALPGPGDYLCLEVRDDGCGMDADVQARVFDPFFTTKSVGQGTGLGLSIVHGIAKAAGGAVTIDSAPGKGTCISVYVPVTHAAPGPSFPAEPVGVPGAGQRLLYVDDEEDLTYLVQYMLKGLGYNVTTRSDPVDALREFRADPSRFDAVITDLAMPLMSGFDLAQAIHETRPETFVVIASGYVSPEDEERAKRSGARAIIHKPQTVEEYAAALDAVFRDAAGVAGGGATPVPAGTGSPPAPPTGAPS